MSLSSTNNKKKRPAAPLSSFWMMTVEAVIPFEGTADTDHFLYTSLEKALADFPARVDQLVGSENWRDGLPGLGREEEEDVHGLVLHDVARIRRRGHGILLDRPCKFFDYKDTKQERHARGDFSNDDDDDDESGKYYYHDPNDKVAKGKDSSVCPFDLRIDFPPKVTLKLVPVQA